MNYKKIIIIGIIIIFVNTCLLIFVFQFKRVPKIDIIEVNDIKQTLAENWDQLESLPGLHYGMDYVVLDKNDNFIAATRDGLNIDIISATINRDTIIDIKQDNQVIGKLIIYNNSNNIWNQYKNNLLIFSILIMIIDIILCFIYAFYINKSIINPFKKLQTFARHVALGNLDMPLKMDKGNIFGAFTESFDIMREELKKARENERKANQSKKELVASLSHDIKTPVSSIKAVSELMAAKTSNENDKKQLEVINSKADQINTLINNMFNATLEELQELKVTVSEQSSRILTELIENADYNNKATISNTSECIILVDVLRLQQVIDNVISNSYKYAGTSIDVSIYLEENFLYIEFKDYGSGVSSDEIPLLFNKYYRAKNSNGKSGTGLGLYISRYMMNKMSGDIDCENTLDGFIIRLKLSLA